ncbi:hypothetical protein KY284_001464 [Solanum tuberosum]|nr:hypothetical protein KY284_001464 [Solanum tuberosum]
MASESNNLKQLILIPSTDSDDRQQSINGVNDANKVSRLPRWTKQEILVLIQGKKVVQDRIHRARTGGMELGSTQVEASGILFHPTVKDKGKVFDILDHGNGNEEGLDLASEREVLFDSSRSVVIGDDGLFSDVPQMNEDAIPMLPSEEPHQPLSQVSPTQVGVRQTTTRGVIKEEVKKEGKESETTQMMKKQGMSNIIY